MKAPWSSLAKQVSEKFGGYTITKAILENISFQEAYDKLIKKGIDPFTGKKLKVLQPL